MLSDKSNAFEVLAAAADSQLAHTATLIDRLISNHSPLDCGGDGTREALIRARDYLRRSIPSSTERRPPENPPKHAEHEMEYGADGKISTVWKKSSSTPSASASSSEDCPHGTSYGGSRKGPCALCEADRREQSDIEQSRQESK